MATSLADVFARLVLDDAQAKRQLAGLGNDPAVGRGVQGLGSKITTGMSRAFTLGGAGAGAMFAGAVEGAGKFDQQLRTIQTVASDLTDTQLQAIGDDIQGLARETGKSTDDLTAGFYDLVSAGVPAGDAIAVLRDSAKFATGALGTTAQSVDLVTSALNAYGLDASHSAQVTDIFAKAVADGKVTAAELGNSLAQVAPIAASAGVSLEEVSAGYALLTAKGVPAAQAATQMRASISALLTPNETLNKLQKETGVNFAELAKEKGLAVALETLRKATKGNADQFAKSLGSIDAYQFALATTGENAVAMADQIAETGSSTGLAQKQYDIASKGMEATAARTGQTISTFLQDVGGSVLPVAGPLLLTLNNLGPALGGLLSPAKLVGSAFGGIATKGIPLLLSGIGGIIPAITGGLTAVGAAIPTLITAAMALWPVLLLAAIVAGIVFLVNNPEIVGKIAEFVGGILSAIGEFLGKVGAIFGTAFAEAVRIVGGAVSSIVRAILSIPGRVASWVGTLIGQAASMVAGFVGNVVGGAGSVVGLVLGIPGRVAGFVGGMIGVAGDALRGFLDIMGQLPGKLMGIVGDAVNAAGRAISNFVSSIDINPFDGHAWGGVAEAGVPTWVGERGPEVMVPGSGTRIVPHHEAISAIRSAAGGGGGGDSTTVNVYNPKPEPASTSVKRVLQVRAAMGRSA